MIIRREIGEKGQVVIPKDIREFLGLKERERIVFEVKDNKVMLKKEQTPEEFLKDFLDVPNKKKRGSTKKLKEIYEEQYEERFKRTY